jgi:hypothetical protein
MLSLRLSQIMRFYEVRPKLYCKHRLNALHVAVQCHALNLLYEAKKRNTFKYDNNMLPLHMFVKELLDLTRGGESYRRHNTPTWHHHTQLLQWGLGAAPGFARLVLLCIHCS